MTHWPHLENLYLYSNPNSPSTPGLGEGLPSPLPSLKGLVIRNCSDAGLFRQLLSLSPNVEQLSVNIRERKQMSEILNAMLSSKNSLRHLHLQALRLKAEFRRTRVAEMPLSFYNALPNLTRLRFLKLTDTFFPPDLLTKTLPPSLEILVIFLFSDDYPALASALEDRGWLPNLRKLTVQAPSPARHRTRRYWHQKETKNVVRQCKIRKCEWHSMVLG
ncbi:hypothetical protein JAAARDRAFT_199233 [Jaapia argillacea MUCL 33604]|uniref:F-box domain-containing protein n=1 Tax=Jaapia argillacea MUCL 33604 TaxID=933084 RepID=A0A067PL51_9AGAM|nr:hypothetical protein JAAARDRAFT_199233 [Jaapia argillacea MUCL 33604]